MLIRVYSDSVLEETATFRDDIIKSLGRAQHTWSTEGSSGQLELRYGRSGIGDRRLGKRILAPAEGRRGQITRSLESVLRG